MPRVYQIFPTLPTTETKAKAEGWRQKFSSASMKSFAYIISWNLWQMDGLKKVIPYSCHAEEDVQHDLFAPSVKRMCSACEKGAIKGTKYLTAAYKLGLKVK